MQVVRKLTRESLQNDCIVSVGTAKNASIRNREDAYENLS